MTVAAVVARATYLENGTPASLATVDTAHGNAPWKFLDATDLAVTRILADGTVVPLTLGTHYTVAGAGGPGAGTVTPLTSIAGATIVIQRNTLVAQPSAYSDNGPFPASTHETALDRQTMGLQDITERAVRAAPDEPGFTLPRMGQRLLSFLGFDSTGLATVLSYATAAAALLNPLKALLGPAYKGDPGGNVMAIGLFTALSAMSIPLGTDLVQASGYRASGVGGGLLIADAAVDSAFVAANPLWSSLSANGRGFRLLDEQRLTIEMFGAYGDATPSVAGTDDNPAFLAAMAFQDTYRYSPSGNTDYKPTPTIWLKNRGYRSSAQLTFAKSGYDFRGLGNNFNGYGGAYVFLDAGQGGFVAHAWDSSGNSLAGTHSPHTYGTDPRGAQNSRLEDISFYSKGGTVGDTTQNGGLIHTAMSMRRVHFINFGGHGVAIVADVANGTNANASNLEDCGAQFCGISGYYDQGGDANAGRNIGFQAFFNNAFGIHAGNFLGQNYWWFQTDGNGLAGSAGPSWGGAANTAGSGASNSGQQYRVIPGQEVGARTNAPSGTTASNTWWLWVRTPAGSGPDPVVTSLYPAWVSGHKYMAGGAFFAGSGDYSANNNARNVFAGYGELDQLGGYSNSSTSCCLPGFASFSPGAGFQAAVGMIGYPWVGAHNQGVTPGHTITAFLGGFPATFDNQFMALGNDPSGAANWSGHIDDNNKIYLRWFGADGSTPFEIYPYTTSTESIRLPRGVKIQNVRHFSGTAAPVSGTWLQGDVFDNETAAAGGTPGWVCTTPGTIATVNWAATTAYAVGAFVLHDTGKTYVCTTAGNSAGSGGPTGTGAGIADGSVVWNYVAPFVFKAMANLAA